MNSEDTVLEIGAGTGFLTSFLKEQCKSVLAVESDRKLVSVLRDQLGEAANVTIIDGDILKASIPSFNKSVSIPPYQISSRLLVWLFNRAFDCAVLVFQREFANRLVATPGSEDYGWLTVFTYYNVEIELLDMIHKSMFYPQPKVDSVITCLRPKTPRAFTSDNLATVKQLLQTFFTHRNRTVRNAALTYLRTVRNATKENAHTVANSLPFGNRRVRELSPEEIGELVDDIIR